MRLNKQLTEEDYQNLVNELLNCDDLDFDLKDCESVFLLGNPKFYAMMFQAVDKTKAESALPNDKVEALNNLERKLNEYTNIVKSDLPVSITHDRSILWQLGDIRTLTFKDSDWEKFTNTIKAKIESIPANLKIPFLEWMGNMLNNNLEKHNIKCQHQTNCAINQGYDRRLQYIAKLIEDAEPKPTMATFSPERNGKPTNKIQWLGTQKELAELFIKLKAKGWIADFEPETIKDCFTNSNSIQQYLKPGEYTEDLGGTYEQVFTPEYAAKFYGMIQNPKRS
jgi:hypothetical protein